MRNAIRIAAAMGLLAAGAGAAVSGAGPSMDVGAKGQQHRTQQNPAQPAQQLPGASLLERLFLASGIRNGRSGYLRRPRGSVARDKRNAVKARNVRRSRGR